MPAFFAAEPIGINLVFRLKANPRKFIIDYFLLIIVFLLFDFPDCVTYHRQEGLSYRLIINSREPAISGAFRRNHQQIVEAGRDSVSALPECFSGESFETISYDGISAVFADRDSKSRVGAVVFGYKECQQSVTNAQISVQDGFELPVTDEPVRFWKRKPLQVCTINLQL